MANKTLSSRLEPWHDLSGKIVMVTGASSGLGRGFCIDLAKAGCRIVAAARRKDQLVSLCKEINGLGGSGNCEGDDNVRAVAVKLDISGKCLDIEASVKKAWDAFGRIDCLINNAGIRGNVLSPLELSKEEWDSTMKTNLTGTWLVSKYISIHMRDANLGGSIINISSVAGLDRPPPRGSLAYSTSKTGVSTLTKVMALELGAYKIRVNSINPGLFMSEITEGLMKKDWIDKVVQRIAPLRTLGTADPALTMLTRYLIHDSSEYISGNSFIVDAGYTLPGVPIFSSL